MTTKAFLWVKVEEGERACRCLLRQHYWWALLLLVFGALAVLNWHWTGILSALSGGWILVDGWQLWQLYQRREKQRNQSATNPEMANAK